MNTTTRWLRLSPAVRQEEVDRHVRLLAYQLAASPRASRGGWLLDMGSESSAPVELLLVAKRRWLTICATTLVRVEPDSLLAPVDDPLVALPVAEGAYELILGQRVDLAFRADLPFLEAVGKSLTRQVERGARRLLAGVRS